MNKGEMFSKGSGGGQTEVKYPVEREVGEVMEQVTDVPIKKQIKEEEIAGEINSVETAEGTRLLKEQEEMLKVTNPEMIVALAEKNPAFKAKLKTALGVLGVLLGLGATAYSFSNGAELGGILSGIIQAGGLGFSIVSAMVTNLKDKVLNIKIPDSWAK